MVGEKIHLPWWSVNHNSGQNRTMPVRIRLIVRISQGGEWWCNLVSLGGNFVWRSVNHNWLPSRSQLMYLFLRQRLDSWLFVFKVWNLVTNSVFIQVLKMKYNECDDKEDIDTAVVDDDDDDLWEASLLMMTPMMTKKMMILLLLLVMMMISCSAITHAPQRGVARPKQGARPLYCFIVSLLFYLF